MAIESLQRKLSGAAGILTIFCKDFDTLKMKIPGQEDAFNVAASIEALSTFGMYIFLMELALELQM